MADSGRFRRDVNPQSVPVSELLAAHKRVRRTEPEAQVSVEELRRRERPTRPNNPARPTGAALSPIAPSRPVRQLPRVLGVAAAVIALSAALVVVAQGLTGSPDTDVAGPMPNTPQAITGAKVFRPDVIKAAVSATAAAAGAEPETAIEDGRQAAASGAPAQPPARAQRQSPAPGSRPAATQTDAAPNLSTGPSAGPSAGLPTQGPDGGLLDPILNPLLNPLDPVIGPILGFYAAAPSQPAQAYQLLDTSVQDGSAEDFASSWSGVMEADVRSARPDGPNAVVVQVALVRVDGTRLLTEQRIEVRRGPKPKIIGARLLSAILG